MKRASESSHGEHSAARVVIPQFFGGPTFPAIAELEGVNERTVKRDRQAARLLLAAEMGMQGAESPASLLPDSSRTRL